MMPDAIYEEEKGSQIEPSEELNPFDHRDSEISAAQVRISIPSHLLGNEEEEKVENGEESAK